jgi:Tol biopolymer transport system component
MVRRLIGGFCALAIAACAGVSPSPSMTATPAPSPAAIASPTPSPTATLAPTAAPTPVEPAGGRIAFRRVGPTNAEGFEQTDVFLVDADGSNLAQLTNDRRIETYLFWLRNGRLAFTWERLNDPYHQFIAVINADGSGRSELGAVQTGYGTALSPDRRYVAFGGDGAPDLETGVKLLDLETGRRIDLTSDGATSPVWSPDGTRILAYLPSRRLVVVDVATGAYLTSIKADVAEVLGWTADGASVLFIACTDDMNKLECMAAPVLVAGLDGSAPRVMADPLPLIALGVPSPDGAWLAQVDSGCTHRIVARTDATELPLDEAVDTTAACSGPAGGVSWSPDSRWLAISEGKLVLVTPLGADRVEITDGPYDGNPTWQPPAPED